MLSSRDRYMHICMYVCVYVYVWRYLEHQREVRSIKQCFGASNNVLEHQTMFWSIKQRLGDNVGVYIIYVCMYVCMHECKLVLCFTQEDYLVNSRHVSANLKPCDWYPANLKTMWLIPANLKPCEWFPPTWKPWLALFSGSSIIRWQ